MTLKAPIPNRNMMYNPTLAIEANHTDKPNSNKEKQKREKKIGGKVVDATYNLKGNLRSKSIKWLIC